jgi:hypothetical protein
MDGFCIDRVARLDQAWDRASRALIENAGTWIEWSTEKPECFHSACRGSRPGAGTRQPAHPQRELDQSGDRLPDYRRYRQSRLPLRRGECRGLPVSLDAFIRNTGSQGRSAALIEALVLQALALDGLGESAEAEGTLDRALSLAEPSGVTRLCGEVADQSALHGLLHRIRDLNLRLIAVQLLDSDGVTPIECRRCRVNKPKYVFWPPTGPEV